MKFSNSLITTIITITSLVIGATVKADTVNARCDVFPKGEDKATSSGLCTFSQRQGNVGIQLENGQRYDLQPLGDTPAEYRDQNGKPAHREDALGERGLIYRLTDVSIFVYWDTAPYNNNSK